MTSQLLIAISLSLSLGQLKVNDPTLRKEVEAARHAEYVTPAQHRQEVVRDGLTKALPALNDHRDFIQEQECDPEIFQDFCRRVQPILINSCAAGACHGGKKTPDYMLQRPVGSSGVTPALSRHNFARTLLMIDKEEPEISPLLKKALETHGGGSKPPLQGRNSTAYKALEAWVRQTAGPDSREKVNDKAELSPDPPSEAARTPDFVASGSVQPASDRTGPMGEAKPRPAGVRQPPARQVPIVPAEKGPDAPLSRENQTPRGRGNSSFFSKMFGR